ncbi:MAG: hypothetical protein LBN99_01815 [Oscillospiraceae bacterium]|jgi:hypothetical protein|nr:hypothetical protein [Oscillospiraceae bacterium]
MSTRINSRIIALALALILALTLAACGGNSGTKPDTGAFSGGSTATPPASSGGGAVTTPDNGGGAAESGLTLTALRQLAVDLGFGVSELTSMQKGAYLNIADGFNVEIIEDSYNPVYEMKSAADAEDAAKKENAAGYNVPFVSGKFYACVGKGNATEEAAMSELMDVEPYGGASAPSGELDKKLVLPDGQAWMEYGEGGMYAGYVFRDDGTWDFCWGEPGDGWGNPEQGKWKIEDGILMLTGDFGTLQYKYKISGGTLTLEERYDPDEYVTYTQQPIPTT